MLADPAVAAASTTVSMRAAASTTASMRAAKGHIVFMQHTGNGDALIRGSLMSDAVRLLGGGFTSSTLRVGYLGDMSLQNRTLV